jgi:peptidoglycan hydrolase-like amidase
LALLLSVPLGFVAAAAAPTPAGAEDGAVTVVITGRGWGHGRGMGQYGALGYTQDQGWDTAQILDHYYGGTVAGPAPVPGVVDPDRVRVDLVGLRGRSTTVALGAGTLHLTTAEGATVARVGGAVRLRAQGDRLALDVGDGCAGPWTEQTIVDQPLVRILAEPTVDPAVDPDGLLQACTTAPRTWYDGELWAVALSGTQRTINLVTVEQYLRGVVPNEVPALWPEAALRAQAVAARSYALAGDHRWSGYADTCDTATCQVYRGRFGDSGGPVASTHPRTDAAIAATGGQVRLTDEGAVARTEFSSSTGGYTAGGDFPPVVDAGDATAANPNHRWRVEVDLASLEDRYDLGPITGLGVVARTGIGPDGGRVASVELRFAEGTRTVTGDTLRLRLGLKSNWFSIGHLTRNGVVQEPIDGELISRYVDRVYRRLEDRAPTAEEAATWRTLVAEGSRADLAWALVRGPRYSGNLIEDLYQGALGRGADPSGRQYWVDAMTSGLRYESVGSLFYGSLEYYRRSGGNDETFIASLYRDLLGREPDDGGRRYWLDRLATGQATTLQVAHSFYRSVESRRARARAVYLRVHDAEPDAARLAYGTDRLATVDDLTLAIELAVDIDLEEP